MSVESINKTVAFVTLGCKLNFSESSTIAGEFLSNGYQRVAQNKPADVYVINMFSYRACRQQVQAGNQKTP